ncbi:MAG TPA: 6-phosphogluconolactonase [Nitrospira sp.]|nr:6-phosphogluconolactonase [Nitrospira sp.]
MSRPPEIRIYPGQTWPESAAALIGREIEETVKRKGRMVLCLSGGSTPRRLYQSLVRPPWDRRCPWHSITFLFGDERCVPPDHAESNYAMAETAFFRPLGIDPGRIYRMQGEHPDPASAARDYEAVIRMVTNVPAPERSRLDAIFLGLGEDGHTASLFPGDAALHEQRSLVTVGHSPKGVPLRLTLTLGAINHASVILFLVTGSAKAQAVRRVLEPRTEADRQLPASLVQPVDGRVFWLLDQEAAAALESVGSRRNDHA